MSCGPVRRSVPAPTVGASETDLTPVAGGVAGSAAGMGSTWSPKPTDAGSARSGRAATPAVTTRPLRLDRALVGALEHGRGVLPPHRDAAGCGSLHGDQHRDRHRESVWVGTG